MTRPRSAATPAPRTQRLVLNPGVAQSYTPTAIGPDGRVYALNNATLHAIGTPR